MMAKYTIAYIDTLGYSRALIENPKGAMGLLTDHLAIKEIRDSDEILHPHASYESSLKEFVELTYVNSFVAYFPYNDSVFICSRSPIAFIKQLSNFFFECLLYRGSDLQFSKEAEGDIRDVKVTTFESVSGCLKKSKDYERWYPPLFRGGIGFVEAEEDDLPRNGSFDLRSMRGDLRNSIEEIVTLEPKRCGPRIKCATKFAVELGGESLPYIDSSYDSPNEYELYWPMAACKRHKKIEHALLNEYGSLVRIALNLWNNFHDIDIKVHYDHFIRLLIESAKRIYPKSLKEIEACFLQAAKYLRIDINLSEFGL